MSHRLTVVALWCAVTLVPVIARGQVQMPNASEMSGRPLATADLPVGTVSVRVVRGGFDKNIPGQPVEFTIDGQSRVVSTNSEGRAVVSGIRSGSQVQAVAIVDGERLESLAFTMGATAMQMALVATDPEDVVRAEEDKVLATAEATKGIVVLGPESRVIVELDEAGLRVFYLMDILNSARTPVDIGGPLIFELPQGARGTAILEASSSQASANGPRFIVTGPFAPGITKLEGAFEVPYRSDTVHLQQVWPATLQQLTLLVEQHGALDIASAQISARNIMMNQGQPLIFATGPAIAAGQALSLDLSGLPHHPVWPRWIALTLALGLVVVGVRTAMTPPPFRRRG